MGKVIVFWSCVGGASALVAWVAVAGTADKVSRKIIKNSR